MQIKRHTHTNDIHFYAFHVFLGGITHAQPTLCIYDSVNKKEHNHSSRRVQKSGIQSNTNVFDEKYFNQIEITRVPVTSGNAVMRHHHPLGSL